MSQNENIIKEQTLNQTQRVPTHDVLMVQAPYNLPHAEFNAIKSDGSWVGRMKSACVGAFIGYVILVIAKIVFVIYINYSSPLPVKFSDTLQGWELWGLGIAAILIIIVYFITAFIPTERKGLIKKIQKHFDDHPSMLEVRKKK